MGSELVVVQRRCALYRHYDEHDVLLYVGISESPVDRTNGHARTSEWVEFAERAEVQWLDSRALAEQAERDAIRAETPIFNRQHAIGDPDARIAEYRRTREMHELANALDLYEAAAQRIVAKFSATDVESAQLWAHQEYAIVGRQPDRAF